MRVGTICYATQSGLGHLGKMFYDNGIISSILVIPHPRYKSQLQWYSPEHVYNLNQWEQFISQIDALLVFENAFNQWNVVETAQRRGIKFFLVPMYEWTPVTLPVKPDFVFCPSLLDVEYFSKYPHKFLHIPAPSLIEIPWIERTTAIRFVHNAGHGQVGYAKGTPEVLEAFAKYVKSDARLLIRGQQNEPRIGELFSRYQGYKNIQIIYDDIPYTDLFIEGDVYINAERYNGLSLPLQEAYSAGMCMMTTNRFPANTWLPNEPLLPVAKYEPHRVSQSVYQRATIDPRTIASYIDSWYGRNISEFSKIGKDWRERNSWENLKPQYLEIMSSVVGGSV